MASTSTPNPSSANAQPQHIPDSRPLSVAAATYTNPHDSIDLPRPPSSQNSKPRRLSWRTSQSPTAHPPISSSTAFSLSTPAPTPSDDTLPLAHQYSRLQQQPLNDHHHHYHTHHHNHSIDSEQDEPLNRKSASKKLEKMIAPYLAQHIPQQYNPLGSADVDARSNANTKFCYRHRPDMLCRRQADEPTMEMLQEVGSLDPPKS